MQTLRALGCIGEFRQCPPLGHVRPGSAHGSQQPLYALAGSQLKRSKHALIPGSKAQRSFTASNFCRRCGHQVSSASPAELSDAPIVLGVTGLNARGRAGTSAETVVEAPLASGTGVLRDQNFSVLHFRARRIRLSPCAARDRDERQKRGERFHLRPPIRCVYGEAILPTLQLSRNRV